LIVHFGRLTYRDFAGSSQPLADLVSVYENIRETRYCYTSRCLTSENTSVHWRLWYCATVRGCTPTSCCTYCVIAMSLMGFSSPASAFYVWNRNRNRQSPEKPGMVPIARHHLVMSGFSYSTSFRHTNTDAQMHSREPESGKPTVQAYKKPTCRILTLTLSLLSPPYSVNSKCSSITRLSSHLHLPFPPR